MNEKATYNSVAVLMGFAPPGASVSATNVKNKAMYDSVATLMGLVHIDKLDDLSPVTGKKLSFPPKELVSMSNMKAKSMYDSVAKLMGFVYVERRKVFKPQGNTIEWRPISGSAAWRDFRRSRRRLLRKSIGAEEAKISQKKLLESLPEDEDMDLEGLPRNELSLLPPTLLRRESSFLITEIEMLELLLDKQEDELDELEEELLRCQNKNRTLNDDLAKKRAALSRLEDKYAKLKVELADSKANEHNLQLELSQKAMVRDLEVINLTNEFNQLVVYMKKLEKERECALQHISCIEKGSSKTEAELPNSRNKMAFLKRNRQ